MKITEKMYLLAKEIVSEYEKEKTNLNFKLDFNGETHDIDPSKSVEWTNEPNNIEVIDPIVVRSKPNKNQIDTLYDDYMAHKHIRESKEKSFAKKEKHETDFSFEVRQCLIDCLYHFDSDLRPNEKDIITWLDTIEKLNRIDKLSFDDILAITIAARSDKFWKKNFCSMLKLRRKDKDKVPYWKVFKEKFKFEQSNTQSMVSNYDQAKKDLGL